MEDVLYCRIEYYLVLNSDNLTKFILNVDSFVANSMYSEMLERFLILFIYNNNYFLIKRIKRILLQTITIPNQIHLTIVIP